jgi:hypothetical protein
MTNSLEPGSSFSDPSPRTTWRWRFEDEAGAEVDTAEGASAGGFPSQSDAESWIGEAWRELLEDGVHQVTLFEGDREVYGPMSLHAAG